MTFVVKSHMKSSVYKTNTHRYLTHTWSDKGKTSCKLRNYFILLCPLQIGFPPKRKNRFAKFFSRFFSRNFALICFVKTCEIFATLKMPKCHEKNNAKIVRKKYCKNFAKKIMRNWKKTFKYFRILRFLFSHFRLIYFREKMRNLAKRFAKCDRKFPFFFSKRFVRWKPYLDKGLHGTIVNRTRQF